MILKRAVHWQELNWPQREAVWAYYRAKCTWLERETQAYIKKEWAKGRLALLFSKEEMKSIKY